MALKARAVKRLEYAHIEGLHGVFIIISSIRSHYLVSQWARKANEELFDPRKFLDVAMGLEYDGTAGSVTRGLGGLNEMDKSRYGVDVVLYNAAGLQ